MRSDRSRHQERGLILIVAMVSIAGLLTLTAVGMTRSLTEQVAAKRFVAKQQAFYLAEAAMDSAVAALKTNPWLAMPASADLQGLSAGTTSHYDIVDAGNGTRRISTIGSAGGLATSTTEAIVAVNPPPLFGWALFGKNRIYYEEDWVSFFTASTYGGLVDSYDSSSGPYAYDVVNPSTPRPLKADLVHVDSPPVGFPAIRQLSMGTTPLHFWGDVVIGGGQNFDTAVQLTPVPQFYGQKLSTTQSVVLPTIVPPAGSPMGSVLNSCPADPVIPMSTFNYSSLILPTNCEIRLVGNSTGVVHLDQLYLSAGSTVKFEGAIKVSTGTLEMGANAQVIVEPTGSAELYVNNTLNTGSGYLRNRTALPKRLALYVKPGCQTPYGFIALAASSLDSYNFYGVVYAPAHQLTMLGRDFFGSFIGTYVLLQRMNANDRVNVHYDTTLGQQAAGVTTTKFLYWHQD